MLAESKFNSIETLISQALGDLDISHEEFIMILKEKDRYTKKDETQFNKWKWRWKEINYKIKQYKIKKVNAIIFFSSFLYIRDG